MLQRDAINTAQEKDLATAIYEVDPARLESGSWCNRRSKTIGEGDIRKSYSADMIGNAGKIRTPFHHAGLLWVSGGVGMNKATSAYSLVHPSKFRGETMLHKEWTAAVSRSPSRAGPLGFYHGLQVNSGKKQLIMQGPAASFVAGEIDQLVLFGE